MNIKKYLPKLLVVVILTITTVSSCRKNDQGADFNFFVSKTYVTSYTTSYINTLLNSVGISVPQITALKSYVESDVDVYKIVYETTVDGKKINASGLVCVPSTPGEYPVLSFQNGTNTIYADAPSEAASDFSYQLIEIIASMGYVVVIADYPGFGVSSQIPHPYLIKEPTVQSLVDLHFAVKEMDVAELAGTHLNGDYYLFGYSQGGWATFALHKAMELEYSADFNLVGSSCGAGPYNIYLLFEEMATVPSYPMPVYLAYIVNAYKAYDQFTNPVSEIFKEPYASRVPTLFNGILRSDQINSQLTSSIPSLLNADFIAGFASSAKFLTVKQAMINNSISPWHSNKPLLLFHGSNDTSVSPAVTESTYSSMIAAGTSETLCKKVIVPGVGHGDGVAPFVIQSIQFLKNLEESN
jgi:pimeloyl-ACP methyl ester carboxylesterase/uncharacterized membrane protein YciS (DUF1049 family)